LSVIPSRPARVWAVAFWAEQVTAGTANVA
jgi:hypothetical protein